MAITKDVGVQDICVKTVTINLADVTSGADVSAIDLPNNSVVLSGSLYTTEAWNSTTSDVLSVGDTTTYNRYLSAGNIRSLAALVPLVPTGIVQPTSGLTVRWVSGGGSPTTGKVRLIVTYVVLGKAEYTYES